MPTVRLAERNFEQMEQPRAAPQFGVRYCGLRERPFASEYSAFHCASCLAANQPPLLPKPLPQVYNRRSRSGVGSCSSVLSAELPEALVRPTFQIFDLAKKKLQFRKYSNATALKY